MTICLCNDDDIPDLEPINYVNNIHNNNLYLNLDRNNNYEELLNLDNQNVKIGVDVNQFLL